MYENFMIDLETLGLTADTAVVNISIIPFNFSDTDSFQELIERGRCFKLDIESQRATRIIDEDTVSWWNQQSEYAKKQLEPCFGDLTVKQALEEIDRFMKNCGIDRSKVFGWSRGTDFDFPIMNSLIKETYGKNANRHSLCRYWNQRDVRTAIATYNELRNEQYFSLPEHWTEGFIPHNSLHDCSKAILELRLTRLLTTMHIQEQCEEYAQKKRNRPFPL